jgi:hypothetical protein
MNSEAGKEEGLEAPLKSLTVKGCCEYLSLTKPDPVLAWIKSGELVARNVSAKTGIGHRPSWRVLQSDFIDFLERRSSQQPLKPPPRKKKRNPLPEGYTRYFS